MYVLTGSLTIVDLGRIEFDKPKFHDTNYIWPERFSHLLPVDLVLSSPSSRGLSSAIARHRLVLELILFTMAQHSACRVHIYEGVL